MNNIGRKVNPKLKMGLVGLSVALLFFTESALALSSLFPDPGVTPYGGGGNVATMSDARAVVARRGGSFQLDSPEAAFKVFSYSSSVTITFLEACNATQWGDWRTRFEVFIMSSGTSEDAALDATPEWTFDTNNCGGTNDIQTSTISGLNRSGKPGHEDWFMLLVKANHIGSGGGINGFRVRTSSGFVTFRDLPDSQRGAWADESVAPYKAFAMLDSVFTGNSRDQDSYEFRFGPDCSWRDGRVAYLKWFDADYGASNEQNGISFTLYEQRAGASGWNPIMTRSGSQLGGDDQFRQAGFSAYKNARYRWVWKDVDNANGIQFWAPFSEIDFNFDCEPEGRVTTINCNVVRGWAYVPGDQSDKVTVRIWIRLSGGAVRSYDVVADDSTPDPPGLPASSTNSGFNWTVPSAYRSDVNYTVMSVDMLYETGNQRIYSGWESRDNSGSPEPCLDPGNWDYQPQTPTGNPADSATGPKPGDSITITGRVSNTNGTRYTGPAYVHRLQVQRDGGSWSNIYNSSAAGMAAGGYRDRSAAYTIPSDADHGDQFCFRTGALAYNGNGVAGTITSSGFTTTVNGPRYSPPLCYTIYNWQYDVNVVAQPDVKGEPNQDVSVEFRLYNVPNGHNDANGPTPSSPRIRVQFSDTYRQGSPSGFVFDQAGLVIDPGDHELRPVDIEIPPDAVVGEEYCVRLRVAGAWGYSDGSDFNTGRIDGPEEICARVTEGPYLQTFGNDIWAGGNYDYDNDGSCTPLPGPGNIISINNTVSGVSFGALNEYGQYALGFVVGFGSAGIANDSHALTFANTELNAGNFQETRCLSRLFDADGTIFDGLWNNSDGELSNISSINNPTASGQYTTPIGDQSMDNANFNGSPGARLQKRFTILVEGDLTIEKSIAISESGWSFGSIPGITFIVSGNIYINPSVERLDGIYIARGTIDTCALDTNDGFSDALTINMCTEHLEVNGKFIANNIAFRRTWGGTNGARPGGNSSRCNFSMVMRQRVMQPGSFYVGNPNISCAAETIRYNPAFYLSEPILNYGIDGDPNDFPIQQIRDLPPVY